MVNFTKATLAGLLLTIGSVHGAAFGEECTDYLHAANELAPQGDCDVGYVCEKIPNEFKGQCMPDPKCYTSCGDQYYETGCSPGDCMLGTYCDTSGEEGICLPGVELTGVNNGRCNVGDEFDEDEWMTLCREESNPCEVAGTGSNCCVGYTCVQGGDLPYPTCAPDPTYDEDASCCMIAKTENCNPGDCCDGSFCFLAGGKSKCKSGVEPSGQHNGLCQVDESLLQCVGHIAAIHGDPHVRTFDDYVYDCMGTGEFLIMKSWYKDFTVQGRFIPVDNPELEPAVLTNNRAIVVNAGEGVSKIQIDLDDDDLQNDFSHLKGDCPVNMYVDETHIDISSAKADNSVFEVDGAKITFTNFTIDIQYDTGAAVVVSITGSSSHKYRCMINAFICLPSDEPDYFTKVTGLLGTPNGNPDDDWILTDGQPTEIIDEDQAEYDFCVANYCLMEETQSEFYYPNDGKDFDFYKGCDPTAPPPVDITDAPQEIIDICGDDKACLVDGIVGGEDAAQDTANNNDYLDNVHDGVTGFAPPPPSNPICPSVELKSGDEINYEVTPIEVLTESTDSVTFKLLNPFTSDISNLFVKYVDSPHGSDHCYTYGPVGTSFEESITAYCMEHIAETVVYVYASDASLATTGSAPQCCEAPEDLPTVSYAFTIKCSPDCPEAVTTDVARRHRALKEEHFARFGNKYNRKM